MRAAREPPTVGREMTETATDHVTFNDFVVDMRVAALLTAEARHRLVTRMFGLPPEDQTFLVSLAVLGGAAGAIAALASHPMPHPSGTQLLMGGAVVNTGLARLAGPPLAAMPLAGAVIGFALLTHAIRPTLSRSIHGIVRAEHDARTAFRTFLGEIPGNVSSRSRSRGDVS